MSEISCTLQREETTRYGDADEDTTMFASLATDVISMTGAESIPSDDRSDADLVTVAEDTFSEDKSVLYSPAPPPAAVALPAVAVSAASPFPAPGRDGEGAFLTEARWIALEFGLVARLCRFSMCHDLSNVSPGFL